MRRGSLTAAQHLGTRLNGLVSAVRDGTADRNDGPTDTGIARLFEPDESTGVVLPEKVADRTQT